MTPIPGVVIGVVTSLEDPDDLGRVRVTFPWMNESEPTSALARIAAPMSGGGRGLQFMPEIDDEALVAFDHGDFRRPYVLGFLWNGREKPPSSEPATRVIKTVSGHVLEFDDTDGSERLSLRFKGDTPAITLDAQAVEIRFSDSSVIRLTDAELTIVNRTLVSVNP
jgi:uncharacterized protein involved in type VI secretion and phage assembly